VRDAIRRHSAAFVLIRESAMRVRSVYFKVTDMEQSVAFWESLLARLPGRRSAHWTEFAIGEVRLGLLLNDFGETLTGSACVPVFEFEAAALAAFAAKARALGASVVVDGLDDPAMNSIVLAAPDGHEFELYKGHG
jgi:catechol 2,3-dioxygenase-like lactoylglutathione lyase family enzyme